MLGNFWKLYAGKSFGNCMLGNFLKTICWEIFWKLYAGNLLMEAMCWEIRVDAGGNYGTQLRHHTTDLRQWHQVCKLSIPAAQIFLERCEERALLEASKVIGRSRRGMQMLSQCWLQK